MSPERKRVRDLAASLDRCQRCELFALRDGRWLGEPSEVAGLRALGLQDDGLGLTPTGHAVAAALEHRS